MLEKAYFTNAGEAFIGTSHEKQPHTTGLFSSTICSPRPKKKDCTQD
jgi:hypothetical protein